LAERLADGDLPARRFGTAWRFSKDAILRWLEGVDRAERIPTGYVKSDG
jgi:hypothetical protein